MDVIAKPRIGNGGAYFVAAGSLAALGVAGWLLGASNGRDTRGLIFAALGLAVVGAATGFLVRLFGLVERRLIEIQTALQPADPTFAPGPLPPPIGVDRYGLPLRPPGIAGLSGGA
jgi:hypothetical protein